MMLRPVFVVPTVLALSHLLSVSALAQPKADVKQPTYQSLSEALELMVDTKGFQEKITFKVALEVFNKQFGNKLPILVDREAFANDLGADAPDPYEEEVSLLPPVPAKMKASQVLRLLLSQVGKRSSVYVIRNGTIEVTTAKMANPESLLSYPVSARFDKKPLEDAIETLCELSGATIVIDARVGDKAKTPVSATFRSTIALEGAVRLLAEMADLQAEVQESVLFITNKPKAGGQQQKTELQFKGRRLDLAVKDLAAWSGQTVLLDPTCVPSPTFLERPFGGNEHRIRIRPGMFPSGSMMILPDELEELLRETKVTASFKSNVSAKVAAEIIARQVGLSVVVMDNLIYITRPCSKSPEGHEKKKP